MASTLYAWACPAVFSSSPVDHTWVTAFDNRTDRYAKIEDVVASGAEYWFCWGVYHGEGQSGVHAAGLLGVQTGDPSQARCVARPNAVSKDEPDARGTVLLYGIHGVCHQIANQVLFATRTTGKPLTVRRARGYWLSDFFWKTYGTNSRTWRERAGTCGLGGGKGAVGMIPEGAVSDLFAQRAAALLSDDPAKLSGLIGLCQEGRAEKTSKALVAPPSAGAINDRNWEIQQEAAAILGETRFRQVFELNPDQYVELVDETMYAAQAGERTSGR